MKKNIVLLSSLLLAGCLTSQQVGNLKYPEIKTVQDACAVYPTDVKDIESRYTILERQVEKALQELLKRNPKEYSIKDVIRDIDLIKANILSLLDILEMVYQVSPDKEVRTVGAEYFKKIQNLHPELITGNKELFDFFNHLSKNINIFWITLLCNVLIQTLTCITFFTLLQNSY
jgi:Zn-dependent oligopeptidase